MFVPPDTLCNNCIFYDKEVDCRIGRLQFYNEKNLKVIKTDKTTIIKEFICPYHRNTDWLESKKDATNLVKEIRQENKLPYIPIILYLNGKILSETLAKIASFDTPPEQLYVVIKQEDDQKKIYELITSILNGTNITWNLHVSLEEDSWHVIFKNYNRHEFLLIISGYPQVNNKWPKVLATKIQDELLKFSYAENKNQTMMLMSPYIYNMYYFDYGKKFVHMLRLQRNKQKWLL